MNLVFKKIKKWLRYPIGFKWLLLEAFILSFKNEIFLKLNIYSPIRDLHNIESIDSSNQKMTNEERVVLLKVAKVVKILQKFAPWKPMCYNRALTAKKLLEKRGVDVIMHIGFRKKDNTFDGHAWISYCGSVITGHLPKLHTFKILQPISD